MILEKQFANCPRVKQILHRVNSPYMCSTSSQVYHSDCSTVGPNSVGVLWDFEFIRECMKTNKIHPKFHFLTKLEIKMTHFVFLFLFFFLSLHFSVEPFGGHFIDI